MPQRWMLWIPNTLSLSRIVFAVFFPFLPPSWRLPVIAVAAVTEFLDGYLARRWNAVTPIGQLLDPIADKFFVLSTAFVMIATGMLSVHEFILVASRDIVVAIGTFTVIGTQQNTSIAQLKPRLSGKLATALQFGMLLALYAHSSFAYHIVQITIFTSGLSAIDYMYRILHARFDQVDSPL